MALVKIINSSSNPLPEYATLGAAGMDVRAHINEPILLKPMQRIAVPTGLQLSIPNGFEVQIRPRSGLALNHGITCANSPATIDSDYRGEIKIILINLSTENFEVKNGDRLAQLILAKVEKIEWQQVTELENTERASGGFGSTGIN
jgi:dUTP pyrophosphatase